MAAVKNRDRVFLSEILTTATLAVALLLLQACASTSRKPASDDGCDFVTDQASMASLDRRNSIAFFWWNTLNSGAAAKAHAKERKKNGLPPINLLEMNLSCLAQKTYAPDVLLLGEAREDAFTSPARAALWQKYPYRREIPYTTLQTNRGFWVLSKIPFEVTSEPLDWIDPKLSKADRAEYERKWTNDYDLNKDYMARPFAVVSFRNGDQVYRVIPVHLLMPWGAIKSASDFGKFASGWELLAGDDHPLYHQIVNLKTKIDQLRTRNPGDRVVVMGDFNMPSEFMNLRPKSWAYMVGGHPKHGSVRDAFNDNSPVTWPAYFGDHDTSPQGVSIDHALVSPQVHVDSAEVLPFVGSDHYPIWLSIRKN